MNSNLFLAGAAMAAAAASMLMAPPQRGRNTFILEDDSNLFTRPMRDITPKAGHMTRQRAADPAKKAARKRQGAARARNRQR